METTCHFNYLIDQIDLSYASYEIAGIVQFARNYKTFVHSFSIVNFSSLQIFNFKYLYWFTKCNY